jgi:hypothetical protein
MFRTSVSKRSWVTLSWSFFSLGPSVSRMALGKLPMPVISMKARRRGSAPASAPPTVVPRLWPTKAMRCPSTSAREASRSTPRRRSINICTKVS